MTKIPPIIRTATCDDAVALASLMDDLGYPVTPDALWARIARMDAPTQRTLVAEIDGAIVGFIGCSALCIYERDTPTCWVMALAVGLPYRRLGAGRALIRAVEHWCREQGIEDIRVHSGEHRHEAHRFYEACGFHNTGVRFKKSVSAES